MLKKQEKQELARRIAVMQAFLDGKKIETTDTNANVKWRPCPNPLWSWHCDNYRIAPSTEQKALDIYINAAYPKQHNDLVRNWGNVDSIQTGLMAVVDAVKAGQL